MNSFSTAKSDLADEVEHASPRIGVIIPACDEEPCLARVLDELFTILDPAVCALAVGVNGSTDHTSQVARDYGVTVGETRERGYGFGCQAAIEALTREHPQIEAYVFFAADGASDPRDVAALLAAHEQGYELVLGTRTTSQRNWLTMSLPHVVANFALALWCGGLCGRVFTDLAPLRLIARDLFEAIAPCEMTFGWTIEAQIAAAMLGAPICEVGASERARIAGHQKVSGVTWRRTFSIGCRILAAGWRTRSRMGRRIREGARPCAVTAVAQPQAGT